MKKLIYLCAIVMICVFSACSKDEGEKQLVMPDRNEQTQSAYADDSHIGGFTFTARSAWSAAIAETRASTVEWLKLLHNGTECYAGEAGTFTLSIELAPNYTGESRSATIKILCGGDRITISVTQDGKTESGEVPENPGDNTGTGTFNYTYSGKPYHVTRVESPNSSSTSINLFFYGEEQGDNDLYLNIFQSANDNLLPGTYTFQDRGAVAGTFYSQKGAIGGAGFYCHGGAVHVTVSGDIYTITLDINTSVDGDGVTNLGKITGTYTGRIKKVN